MTRILVSPPTTPDELLSDILKRWKIETDETRKATWYSLYENAKAAHFNDALELALYCIEHWIIWENRYYEPRKGVNDAP